MDKYTCIIVDDETLARELLARHVAKIPHLELLASCSNAIEAKSDLDKLNPDILFIDISMPFLTGLELLRMLKKQPATIITTAYSEHALEGYELEVLDYLLKPIEFGRFFKAVSKATEWIDQRRYSQHQADKTALHPPPTTAIYVKSDAKIVRVVFSEILFIEAMGKYVCIQTTSGRVIALLSITQLEEVLPAGQFVRNHRSYIVNLDQISSIEGNMIQIGKHRLPLSKGQRNTVIEILRNRGIGW